jgi:hypothetical protein
VTSLRDLEQLEYTAVDLLARPSCSRADSDVLAGILTKVRALKAAYLAQHPNVLRKGAAKLHTAPLDRDRPNAKNPDDTLSSDSGPLHFRAPAHLRDMTLHLSTGHALSVPPSGVVEIAADHVDVQDALRESGFVQLRGIDRSGKAADNGPDPADAFHRSRLTRIGGGDTDLLRALGARAIKAAVAPIERRIETDDRAPALGYARSLEEFYRRYLNRSF